MANTTMFTIVNPEAGFYSRRAEALVNLLLPLPHADLSRIIFNHFLQTQRLYSGAYMSTSRFRVCGLPQPS